MHYFLMQVEKDNPNDAPESGDKQPLPTKK
ncbi:hypothetical protein [Siccibacter colletis]